VLLHDPGNRLLAHASHDYSRTLNEAVVQAIVTRDCSALWGIVRKRRILRVVGQTHLLSIRLGPHPGLLAAFGGHGGNALGHLWVLPGQGRDGRTALESACPAVHTALCSRTNDNNGIEIGHQWVHELLFSDAERTRQPPPPHWAVAAFGTTHERFSPLPLLAATLALAVARTDLEPAYQPGQRAVHLLMCTPDESTADRLRLLEHIAGELNRSLGTDIRAGLGGTLAPPCTPAMSRREAEDVLDAVWKSNLTVGSLQQQYSRVVVTRAARSLHLSPRLSSSPIDQLAAADAARGSDLLRTLTCWLDHRCDTKRAADTMTLHVNTVRYRLGRASAITQLDLDDSTTRFALQLEILGLVRPEASDCSPRDPSIVSRAVEHQRP
jgi:hypothetical protein